MIATLLKGASLESIDPRTQHALERIKSALSRRSGSEAVRFFKEASSNGLIPADGDLVKWLQERLGEQSTEALLAAYSRLPCFYCNKGIIECEFCEGKGHDADNTLCTRCLSLGIDRCDFCGGSGWFTINHVPHSLQLPVIVRRVVAASKETDALLANPVPVVSADNGAQIRKEAGKSLLQVNRLLGVAENMMLAAKQVESRDAESAETTGKIIAACEALGNKLRDRLCRLLEVLAEASKAESLSATDPEARQVAEKKADFYAGLADSKNMTGTSLRHPMLEPPETGTAEAQNQENESEDGEPSSPSGDA